MRKTNILIYLGFCFFVVKTKAISDENRQLTNKLDSILCKHFTSDAPGCAVFETLMPFDFKILNN
jgi:hypothetical protein